MHDFALLANIQNNSYMETLTGMLVLLPREPDDYIYVFLHTQNLTKVITNHAVESHSH